MSKSDNNRWKEKYLASLDEIEAKEKAWDQLEKVLRQSLSRLTFAVETSDRRLSTQLESLRGAIRKKATASQIGKLMEEISSSILRLDQQRDGNGEIEAALSGLEDKLEDPRLPDGLKRTTRELKRRLRDAGKTNDLKEALDAYSAYLDQILGWLATPQQDDKEGLLGRLFGRRDAGQSNEHPSPPAESPESGSDQAPATASSERLPPCNEVLFDLIHRLDLPSELSEQCQRIGTLLSEHPTNESADRAVVEIAELIAKTRHLVEQEKKDIETFLSQLTGRLGELDRYLEDSVGNLEQAVKEGDALDQSVSAEVAGIRRSVSEAEDIHQLQQSIQAHLTNIQLHMDARRRMEQDRISQAETEIDHLKQALSRVQEESLELNARLNEARERALHDALTGLHNRLAYDERIAHECERWERYGRPTVLSIWDVDHFKRINDAYGHSAGDNVLKILGRLLNQHTRKSDFIARFGGEEFILLLPETGIETAFEVTEKLRQLIAESEFLYRGEPVKVSMSCGMAEFIAGDTPDDVYRRADTALYEAKQDGRNCCKIYGHSARPMA